MKIFSPMQIMHNQRTLEQNKQFHWVVSPSLFMRISTGKIELQHDCIADVISSMGDIPMLDMGMPKPKGEWLLNGALFAGKGQTINAGQAKVKIANHSKAINVFGDRQWQAGLPSSPEYFESMPLDYHHAFGGDTFNLNPTGKGFKTNDLPNTESPSDTITNNNKHYSPASFAPIDPSWPQRAQHQGTYDKHYMDNFFPGYPKDMDWRLFMNAAEDQWLDDFFIGDEAFELHHMHPEKTLQEGKLPGLLPRCFIKDTSEPTSNQFKEVKLHLDTVWFFPDKDIVQLIWRGGMVVKSDEAEEISHMLMAYENSKDSPRNSEHYQQSLEKRIRDKDPLQDSLNTLDLIPLGEASAMQLLQKSAFENSTNSALADNIESKSEAIKSIVDQKIDESLQDLKKQLENPGLNDKQKNEILAKIESIMGAKDQDKDTALLLEKLNEILPGLTSSKSSELDLSNFSFKKLDEIFAEIDLFSEAKKTIALEEIKPQIEQLTQQLENTDTLNDEQRQLIEGQIDALKSLFDQDIKPPLSELPRFDCESIKQQVDNASPEIQAAQQELHLMLANPMLADSTAIKKAKEKLEQLEQGELAKIKTELDSAKLKFIEGYAMGAHFADHGLSPHKDDNLQRNKLLSIASGDKDASNQDWACLDLSGLDLDGIDFSNCLMEQVNLTGASLIGANFTGAILARSDLSKANCSQANFEQTNLGASIFNETIFSGASFNESKLSKSEFISCTFTHSSIKQPEALEIKINQCDFTSSKIENWPFLELAMKGNIFDQASMTSCSFINCTLDDCSFDNAALPSTTWANSSLRNTVFHNANMLSNCFVSSAENDDSQEPSYFENIDFSHAMLDKSNFQGLDLAGNNFNHAKIASSNFTSANLANSNFDDCDGYQAQFRKAKLTNASMKRANLMEAMLSKAIINNTNLEQANLYGVDFIRATIKGTRFHNANLDATILRDWRPS